MMYPRAKSLWLILTLSLMFCLPAHGDAVTVRHGDRDSPKIAITVDDCYDISKVQDIVALCQEYDIKCTFFVIGSALKYEDSETWKSVVDMGCEIGNHTWNHINLTKLNAHRVKFEMLRTQEKVDALLGYHYQMQVMRPPFGKTNIYVQRYVSEIGYQCVTKWDVSQTNPEIAIRKVQNGSILLYHARAKDVRCLKKIIPACVQAGYQCVTVSDLMGLEAIKTSNEPYIYAKEQ